MDPRKSLSSKEIPYVLQKASLFGGMATQPTAEKTIRSQIKAIEADKNGLLVFSFQGDNEFETGRPLCVMLNYRDIYFQFDSTEFSVNGQSVVSPFPREVKALQVRDYERYVLPLNSQIQTDLYRIEKRGGTFGTLANIVDVSRKGMGLLLTNTEEQMIVANDHLWIRNINGTSLVNPIFGKVIYTHERKYKDGLLDIKTGISLETEIPEDVFSSLQQMCKLVLR